MCNTHYALHSGVDLNGKVKGIAYVSTMCSEEAVGLNQDHRRPIKYIGSTVAHELGHSLNMRHDNIPSSENSVNYFSIKDIARQR